MTQLEMPERGVAPDELLATMDAMREGDAKWEEGRTWSLVYHASDAHKDLLARAHRLFMSTNGLNPMAFRSLKRMEAEVVAMSASMLHGDDAVVGTMTSGGTESLLLAVKAARERARRRRPWIRHPEIVAPATIHVAFDKAAHYFGVKLRRVPVAGDYRADVAAMKRRIGRNTILIAASAPQYPHGVVDPIEELGALAEQRGLPFHVDACFGGFILPWLEKLGVPVPTFDFRVPGVTSISADVHKYGYAAKGASVVLYRTMDYLKHQFFISTDWCGGIYASPTLAGTRPGGPIAAAWASMMALGSDGYLDLARITWETREVLYGGIEAIEGLRILGSQHTPVVTYQGVDVDTFAVADQMQARGWGVDRQQNPNCVHCSISAGNHQAVEAYLADLRDVVAIVRANPALAREGEAAMYGMMAKIPVRGAVRYSVGKVMEQMYAPGGAVPDMGKLGEEGDGGIFALIERYGDRAMALFEAADRLRRRARIFPRR